MNTKLFAVMVATTIVLSACAETAPTSKDQSVGSVPADVKTENEVAATPVLDERPLDPVIAKQAAQAKASADEAAAVAAAALNEEAIKEAIQAQARMADESSSESPAQSQ